LRLVRPVLSVVVPAFNEADRLPATLDRVLAFLRARGSAFDISVVDDGSTDATAAVVAGRSDPEVRLIRLGQNQGKGAAVRRGVLESQGTLTLVSDADLSTPIEELARLEAALDAGVDIVCGSRGLPDSTIVTSQPVHRRQMGNAFNVILRLLALTPLRDTQCGFKLFRGSVARDVFARCTVRGFAYDVECLFLAERLGFGGDGVGPHPVHHVRHEADAAGGGQRPGGDERRSKHLRNEDSTTHGNLPVARAQ
jgi:dolichyl-phosphate beta-glucosyltransferase